jgi:hypothetical protein
MPSLAPEVLSRSLRQTNDRLRALLDSFASAPAPTWASAQITTLLAELRQAGDWLREGIPQAEFDIELNTEIECYRRNIERLRDILPLIHRQLLAERARLATERERIEAAAKWAQASQQSL